MNNYSNMNFYTNQMNPGLSGFNIPIMENKNYNNLDDNEINPNLQKKLSTQAGDNMNFNKCGYNQKVNPNEVYDVYEGYIRGNMFPDLYNTYKLTRPYNIEPLNEEAEMLTYFNAYSFAAHDLGLYLDNNPKDKDMIELYKAYTNQANEVKTEYEKKFGPLTASYSTYPWTWNNSPWPWENK